MGKSLKNAVSPDEIAVEFGCDTFRLYEMYLGPLETIQAVVHAKHNRSTSLLESRLAEPRR